MKNCNKKKLIAICVKANAKENKVIERDNELKILVKSPAEKNKANKEVIEVLANYCDCAKSQISIIKGHKQKNKLVEIKKPLFRDKIKINISKKHCWSR